MISRDLQVSKFIFENSLHSQEIFFPCPCVIARFFEFLHLDNSSMDPVFSYNQVNKQPESIHANYRGVFRLFHPASREMVVLTM